MDPNQEIENIGDVADEDGADTSVSVDDFIRQLEEKEKDLHITAETTIIEIEESFDDGVPEFIKKELPKGLQPSAATAPAPNAQPKASPGANFKEEIAGLQETISQLKTEREEMLMAAQRRSKDFENFKTRTERERRETFQNQLGNLAGKMLPALDNLNRALDFALAMPEEKRDSIQQFLDGVVLVNQQVNDVLAEMGVRPIASIGETFDPHLHEAVATDDSSELAPNTIAAELLRGYRIGDRVIRHSMVKVAKGSGAGIDDVDDDVDEEIHKTVDMGSIHDTVDEELPDLPNED
jgi:molecular chaperone GrpE